MASLTKGSWLLDTKDRILQDDYILLQIKHRKLSIEQEYCTLNTESCTLHLVYFSLDTDNYKLEKEGWAHKQSCGLYTLYQIEQRQKLRLLKDHNFMLFKLCILGTLRS